MASKFKRGGRVFRKVSVRGERFEVPCEVLKIRAVDKTWLRDRGIMDYSNSYVYTLRDLEGPFGGTEAEVLEQWLRDGSID